jgi:hypothetical protein
MIDLAAAFRAVVAALDLIEAEYVIVGSTAAAGWGVARATRDVDLVAMIPASAVDALLGSLERDDLYVPSAEVRRVVAAGGSFNVLHMASGGKVDVFVSADDDAFERSRLDRRIASEVCGVSSWISTPEDVVLSKLRQRPESRSEVHWRDCVEIAAVQRLDRDYLYRWAPALGIVDDLTSLLTAASRLPRVNGSRTLPP